LKSLELRLSGDDGAAVTRLDGLPEPLDRVGFTARERGDGGGITEDGRVLRIERKRLTHRLLRLGGVTRLRKGGGDALVGLRVLRIQA
jgi:hypothetical protein